MTRRKERMIVATVLAISIFWLVSSAIALPLSGVIQGRITWSTPMSAAAKRAFIPWLATGLLFGLFHLLSLIGLNFTGKRLASGLLVLATVVIDFGLLYLCDALIAGFAIPTFSCALLTIGLMYSPLLVPMAITLVVGVVSIVVGVIVLLVDAIRY